VLKGGRAEPEKAKEKIEAQAETVVQVEEKAVVSVKRRSKKRCPLPWRR
jgi:hypothetical protein